MMLFFFSHVSAKILKDRTLSITTKGPWADTPLISEAAAFIADANGEAYWTFLRGFKKVEKSKLLGKIILLDENNQ